jgi:acyl-CoA thioester hydrolase
MRFIFPVRVYYEDTDFSGVVYHARYLHFFERGRTEAIRECGVTHTDLLEREEPLAFAVRRMKIDWIVPARMDDLLEVRTEFAEAKGARMSLRQDLRRGETLLAAAEVEIACISRDGRARRLPEDVLAKFRGP